MRRAHFVPSMLTLLATLGSCAAILARPELPPLPGGSHGTAVNFGSAAEAVHRASEEKKLLLLVHISGVFEDPTFT
jgi:hypothetical protein